jgi:predicted DNA-binding antitoxin AbrB/MazE fold protein
MATIRAIFEDGVFRPLDRVELSEPCTVEFEPQLIDRPEGARPVPGSLDATYEVLSRRSASGESDVAARHDEHQP